MRSGNPFRSILSANQASPRPTFGGLLDTYRGVGPSFDIIRFGLAFVIFYGHCHGIAGASYTGDPAHFDVERYVYRHGGPVWDGPKRALHAALLPMFFALSGFLVAGSAFRVRSASTFFAFRALRIVPALSVEVLLSALILGPIFTQLPLFDYFTDPKFFAYFGNIFGLVAFELPGVFLENPIPKIVNLNLWTLPPEFYCYLGLIILIFTKYLYDRKIFTLVLAAVTVPLLIANSFFEYGVKRGPLPSSVIIYYFFIGCAFFHWREKIVYSKFLFVACALISFVLLSFQRANFIAPAFLTYVVVFAGLTSPPNLALLDKALALLRSGDYSYGVYLYGFPISQALIAAVPSFKGNGWALFASALCLTIVFAVFSWFTIEKPTLKLKKLLAPRKAAITVELISDRQTATDSPVVADVHGR